MSSESTQLSDARNNGKCSRKRLCIVGLFSVLFMGIFLYYGLDYHVFRIHPQALPLRKSLPGAIIIGVKKGGTRALLNMLKIHPGISAATGEVHFFDRNNTYLRGKSWYVNRMPATSSDQLVIEKTPAYFVTPYVPERIHKLLPNLKVILIVRDPVQRVISDFAQLSSKRAVKKMAKLNFSSTVFYPSGKIKKKSRILRVSLYDVHYKRWLRYFNKSQIHIVNGDKFIKNPYSELHKLEQFLPVKSYFRESMFVLNKTKGFYCWRRPHTNIKVFKNTVLDPPPTDGSTRMATVCLGKGKGRKHPDVSLRTIKKLKKYYRPFMKHFYQLSGQNFGW